ncbi:guanylate kinase [Neobacillus mesonae]|uniref:guanylate kinase n=1 Tax=Neobacillus mesonae TaxID=1193713 RepID=UPI00203E6DE3|nr:guanylate kinase [Neobacillus mesonae]MCM3570965.1 guanylate kinase [Neobacillus mesonae]
MYQIKGKERIFVYTGPDGSGRKTIAKMTATAFDMEAVISYTTRSPRHYEKNGEDYHFVSEETFKQMEAEQVFLESVEIDGFHYGIREQDVAEAFKNHNLVYLTLNPEGAEKLKSLYGEKVTRIFVYADRDTVIKRHREREDTEDVINRHLSHYDETMNYKSSCEHAFENFDSPQVAYQVSELIETYLDRNLTVTDY